MFAVELNLHPEFVNPIIIKKLRWCSPLRGPKRPKRARKHWPLIVFDVVYHTSNHALNRGRRCKGGQYDGAFRISVSVRRI